MRSNGHSVSSPRRRLHLKLDKDLGANVVDGGGNEINEELSLFPPVAIILVTLFTLWSRVTMAASNENLWMVHPDEVYQSVEVAHSQVYGYGFRPYEFLHPPPEGSAALSPSQSRHAELGMYSLRSWLYPRVYQALFVTSEYFNWNTLSPFHLARTFHACVAAFLPLAVYQFARAIYLDIDAAMVAAILVAFSQPLIVLGTHTFVQSFISPIIFALTAVCFKVQSRDRFFLYLACGFGYGLLVSIRFDVLVVVFVILTTHYPKINHPWFVCLGFLLGLITGGYNDYRDYGVWFVSTWRWFTFQMKYSHKLFGSQPVSTYFSLAIGNNHLVLILAVFSLIFIFFYLATLVRPKSFQPELLSLLNATIRLLSSTLILFTIYSLHRHKEARFVHDVLVLFQISLAGSALLILRYAWNFLSTARLFTSSRRLLFKLLIYGELLLYSFEGRFRCPRSSISSTVRPWSYAGLTESGNVNQALTYISRQNDVSGLVLDYSIHMCAGYSLIHHNVPIIAKTHLEFREWDKNSRLKITDRVTVSTIDGVSNFISLHNTQLLLKYIINKEEYNYLVTTGGRRLPKHGFRQVFNVSDVRVYKRSKSRYEKEMLRKIGEKLPVGKNATVLEYEGSWLVTLELYDKAVERLEMALQLDSSRIRVWQLLHLSLVELNELQRAKEVMEKCSVVNSKLKCHSQQDKVVIHPEYEINV